MIEKAAVMDGWEEDLEVEHLKKNPKPKKKKIAKVVKPPKVTTTASSTTISKPADTDTGGTLKKKKPAPKKTRVKEVKSKRGRVIKDCFKSDGRGRTSRMQESWFKRVAKKNPRKPTNQPGHDVWEFLALAEEQGNGRFSYYDYVLLGGKLTELRYDIRVGRIKMFDRPAPEKKAKAKKKK